jgi:EAL and modified HD-GYP domain-containing signal transduction protein
MITDHYIPAGKTVGLRLLREITLPELNIEAIEDLLRREPALTYKLLRYLNSPLLGLNSEVREISQAVLLLGETEFRRWISIVAVVSLVTGKPIELTRTAVLRGYFCEQIAEASGQTAAGPELFLMGLLSVADAMLDRPMERILAELPLSEELDQALRGKESRFRGVYDLMIAYERGTWNSVSKAAGRIGIEETRLPDCYMGATEKAELI